jgi:hypothetical protein
MVHNKMDDIHLYWNHCTNVKELKIDGENVSSIADISNTIYVNKAGSDETVNGSFGNPFLTIDHANNIAISMVNSVLLLIGMN